MTTAKSPPPQAMPELTFSEFRRANVARCIKWHPAGIDSWSPSDWLTAVTGELGELASLLKMRNRERDGLPGNKFSPSNKMVADEIADVLTYLDLLAEVLNVDLGNAAVSKFNEVSERVGFPDRIAAASAPAEKPSAEYRLLFMDYENLKQLYGAACRRLQELGEPSVSLPATLQPAPAKAEGGGERG